MIEHPINQDAGEGDVKPDREGNAGDRDVAVELAFEGAAECDEGQRHHGDGKNCVRDEDCEINRTDPTLSRERRGAVKIVVGEIGDEKKR